MDISFKAVHLLLPELNYELRIRNTFTQKSQEDKRKILGRLLVKERQQNVDVSKLQDPNYDFNTEKSEIETTLLSIENLISDFEGPSTDSCFKRANSRLMHVTLRIQRIVVEGVKDEEKDIIRDYKNEAYASALKLEAQLHDSVKDTDPNTFLNSSVINPNILNSSSQPAIQSTHSKSVPVYKLGVQFDGSPKSLLSFIEKIEEVSCARNVSKSDLFNSASDLFSDKATFWFRQIKSSVSDWDSLVGKLKKDFLTSDFDDEIWNQIKSRRQGRNEPVILYIACMETLFSRLSNHPAVVTKVKYIKHGLQPEYQKRLALCDVDNVEVLSNLCKKLEEADVLSLASTSSQSKCTIDTELAYLSDSRISTVNKKQKDFSPKNNKPFNKNKFNSFGTSSKNSSSPKNQSFKNQNKTTNLNVNAVDFSPKSESKSVTCWSCGLANHTFRNCLSPVKRKFCFKCGFPNVTSKDCKNCSGNA